MSERIFITCPHCGKDLVTENSFVSFAEFRRLRLIKIRQHFLDSPTCQKAEETKNLAQEKN